MDYYKVVKVIDGKYYSILFKMSYSDPIDNDIFIEYKKDTWVYPKIENSGLFVFNNLKSAWLYSDPASNNLIFRCACKGFIKKDEMLWFGCLPKENLVYDFWNNNSITIWNSISLFDNTVLCKSVKLIEEVKI